MNRREMKQKSEELLFGEYAPPGFADMVISGEPFQIYGFTLLSGYDGIHLVSEAKGVSDPSEMGKFKDDLIKAETTMERIRMAGQDFINKEMSTPGGILWMILVRRAFPKNIEFPIARINGFSRVRDDGFPDIFYRVETFNPSTMNNPFFKVLILECARCIFEQVRAFLRVDIGD